MKKQFTNKARYLGLKLTAIVFALLLISGQSWGQATLPVTATFSTVTTSGPGTMPTGFTQSGLGGYAGSLKFDTQGDWIQLNFTGTPGTLTFDIGVNNSFPGTIPTTATFTVEESSNGTNWSPIGTYSNVAGGTKTISTINSSTQYIRWFYTTKPSGTNISLKNIGLTAGITTPTTQASAITFSSVTSTGMKIDWTNGNGTSRAVFLKEASGSITNPVDGTSYTASSNWSSKGTQLGTSGYYCVYNGTGTTVTITNLVAGTAYYVQVFEYNGSGATSKYYTATATNNPNNQTTSAASSPLITVTGTINAFASTVINTTSSEQSYTVQGANLSDNITITPPVGFQISKTSGSGFVSNPGNLTFTPAEVASAQNVYVIFAPTVVQAYSGDITHTSTGATQIDKALSGTGIKAEPTNHATLFEAVTGTPSYSAIIVSWSDATGAVVPDGYLIKGSSVGYGSIIDPIDGTAEADGGLVKNIAQGTGIYEFTGLSASTPYYFKIYPYTNSSSAINYKTDPTIPQATATTDAPASVKWDGGASTSAWTDAANWNNNVVPSVTDEVILDNSLLAGSYSVTLPTGAVKTTIKKLTITPTLPNIITLTLPVGNTYGASNDAGFVVGDNTASTDDIIINEGGVLVNASGGSTGNGIQVNALANGTLRINNGGKFIHNTSRSAAGTAAAIILSTVTGTEYGIYEYDVPGTGSYAFAATGRTYGSLILSRTSGAATYTSTGANPLIIKGDFTMNSGITYNSGMTGSMSIGRNLINNGSVLTIPVGQAVNFNGSSAQVISGSNSISILGSTTITNTSGVTLSQNATFNNLTIDANSIFSIASGKQLTVTGTLTNSAGNTGLVLKSDATGTASLITSSSVGATVERYITHYSGPTDGWRLVSSPVGTTAIGNFLPSTNDDFYSYSETDNEWKNYKVSPFGFTNGLGYLSAYETSATKSFSGALNTADIPIANQSLTPTKGNGWQLLGNPFTSAIKWNDGNWALSNVSAAAKLLNGGGSYTDLAANDIIPAMQGFFVKVLDATNSITIPALARTHSTNILNKASQEEKLVLKASSIGNSTYVESTVKTNANATNSFDALYDANFLAGMYGAPQLYSIITNDQLSTNTIAPITSNLAIPMGFVAGLATNYKITADGLSNFTMCSTITLEDLKTNTTQNLMQNPVYNFAATTTDNANRFVLHFATSVGVNEIGKTNGGIYAYDNNIYVNTNEQIKQISVYNAMGQLIKTVNNGNCLQKINMNGHASGYYIVKVISDKNVYSEKVLIK